MFGLKPPATALPVFVPANGAHKQHLSSVSAASAALSTSSFEHAQREHAEDSSGNASEATSASETRNGGLLSRRRESPPARIAGRAPSPRRRNVSKRNKARPKPRGQNGAAKKRSPFAARTSILASSQRRHSKPKSQDYGDGAPGGLPSSFCGRACRFLARAAAASLLALMLAGLVMDGSPMPRGLLRGSRAEAAGPAVLPPAQNATRLEKLEVWLKDLSMKLPLGVSQLERERLMDEFQRLTQQLEQARNETVQAQAKADLETKRANEAKQKQAQGDQFAASLTQELDAVQMKLLEAKRQLDAAKQRSQEDLDEMKSKEDRLAELVKLYEGAVKKYTHLQAPPAASGGLAPPRPLPTPVLAEDIPAAFEEASARGSADPSLLVIDASRIPSDFYDAPPGSLGDTEFSWALFAGDLLLLASLRKFVFPLSAKMLADSVLESLRDGADALRLEVRAAAAGGGRCAVFAVSGKGDVLGKSPPQAGQHACDRLRDIIQRAMARDDLYRNDAAPGPPPPDPAADPPAVGAEAGPAAPAAPFANASAAEPAAAAAARGPEAAGAPPEAAGAPLEAAGAPPEAAGAPLEAVGAPLEAAGAPVPPEDANASATAGEPGGAAEQGAGGAAPAGRR